MSSQDLLDLQEKKINALQLKIKDLEQKNNRLQEIVNHYYKMLERER